MVIARTAVAIACAGAFVALAIARASPDARGSLHGTIDVKRAVGIPAGPIVVYVVGFSESPPDALVSITQVHKRFVPDLVAVTAGQSVAFPNADPILHNVFSPTAERSFDLGSFPKDEARKRKFPSSGVIEVYCNIHPEMSATILVLPNRRFVFADASGKFELNDLPAGTWTVFVYSRRAVHPGQATVTIKAGEVASANLVLDESKRDFMHPNKFGEKYRDDSNVYNPER